jgi:hypothetical protein
MVLFSRVLIQLWRGVFAFRPGLVGGCHPLNLLDFISEKMWQVIHHGSVVAFDIPSDVVVASKSSA